MSIVRISATKLRSNLFEILNMVSAGSSVIIEKDKKEIAILSPKKNITDLEKLKLASKKVHGILKNDLKPSAKDTWKDLGDWDKV